MSRKERLSSEEAFEAFLPAVGRRLEHYARSLMPPALAAFCEPADVVQAAVLSAWRKRDGFLADSPSSFFAWLMRFVQLEVLNLVRQASRKKRRKAWNQWRSPSKRVLPGGL